MKITRESFSALTITIMPLLSIIGLLFRNDNGTVLIATMALLLILILFNYRSALDNNNLFLFFLSVVSVIITNIMFPALGVSLIVINVLLASILFNNIYISKRLYYRIRIITSISLLIYVLTCSTKSLAYYAAVKDALGNNLNANDYALIVFICYLNVVSVLDLMQKTKLKVFLIFVMSIGAGFLLYLSQCRTAIIGIIAFLVLILFMKNRLTYYKFRRVTLWLLLLSFLFPLVYLFLSKQGIHVDVLGKSLFTGRQIIWEGAWNLIKQHPLFGCGNTPYATGFTAAYETSSHNFLLGVMKMFGLIPTISVFWCLTRRVKYNSNLAQNRIMQIMFISSLFVTFTESSFVQSYIYLPYVMLLIPYATNEEETGDII